MASARSAARRARVDGLASSADDAGRRRGARRDADDADAPRLPLRRRQTTNRGAGALAWLAAAGDHPVLAAVGAVLTVMLPTRVASTLHLRVAPPGSTPRAGPRWSSARPGEDSASLWLSRRCRARAATRPSPATGPRASCGGTPPPAGYKPNPLIARNLRASPQPRRHRRRRDWVQTSSPDGIQAGARLCCQSL